MSLSDPVTVRAADHRPKVVISINSAWNIVNFRLGLVRGLQTAGYRVIAVTPSDRYVAQFRELGIEHHPIAIDNRGTSPVRDLVLFFAYWRILGAVRPDIYLGYTIKPNIWGSLAAQLHGIPVINNIAGLGQTFGSRGLLQRFVRGLYRVSLARSRTVFFQNPDDRAMFVQAGIVSADKTRLLPGSGIDLSRFRPPRRKSPSPGQPFVFLLVARLLWAKGVGDFVAAARTIRVDMPNAYFRLLGIVQDGVDAIDRGTLDEWAASRVIELLGATDEVEQHLAGADCVVLPTFYPEGTPRSLLEAAATGRPIITTDVPGCREVVIDGVNGFLVSPRNPDLLAEAMRSMLGMPVDQRDRMGSASRHRAEQVFDEHIVVDRYLSAIAACIGHAAR